MGRMSNYPPMFFADAAGRVYTASQTDQSGRRQTDDSRRTVGGRPLALVGRWYGVQTAYRPFAAAVAAAAASLKPSPPDDCPCGCEGDYECHRGGAA